jgi:hypothetical protein
MTQGWTFQSELNKLLLAMYMSPVQRNHPNTHKFCDHPPCPSGSLLEKNIEMSKILNSKKTMMPDVSAHVV